MASVERFLAHLAAIERSPDTVRAYASSLALWWERLELRDSVWKGVKVEDVSQLVRWLRAPADGVMMLDASAARRIEATVNRHLAGCSPSTTSTREAGVELAADLVAWRRVLLFVVRNTDVSEVNSC